MQKNVTSYRCGREEGDARRVSVALLKRWVGLVWSRQNSLINMVHPSDHLEQLLFSGRVLLKLALF